MTTAENEAEIVAAADRLSDKIEELREESRNAEARAIQAEKKSAKTSRRVWRIAAVVLIDILFTFSVFFLVNQNHNNVQAIQNTAYQACLTANESRAKVDIVWHQFIALLIGTSSHPNTSSQNQARANAFLKYVDTIYKPQPCRR
jgi:cell division protein ZapA (FtsZ GTPase activity inhibitor)